MRFLTLLAVPPLLVAAAPPASAELAGGRCGTLQLLVDQACAGAAQSVTADGVTVSCTAVSASLVRATSVQCFLIGAAGDQHLTDEVTTPGLASTLTHTFDAAAMGSSTYTLCVAGGHVDLAGDAVGANGYACGITIRLPR